MPLPEPVIHLTLDQLHVLDVHAVAVDAPPAVDTFTVSLWFQTSVWRGRRVLVSHGQRETDAPGWALLLEDDRLVLRVVAIDGHAVEASISLSPAEVWRFAVASLDRADGQLRLMSGNAAATVALPAAFGAVTPDAPLLVGGFTDPAGGHFDHTFGRNGTGWIDDLRLYDRALPHDALVAGVGADSLNVRAAFTFASERDEAPARVRFDGSATAGNARAWLWEFGDGARGYGRAVEHDYAYAGVYTVTVTAVGGDHQTDRTVRTLTLAGQPNPLSPVEVFATGTEGYACFRIPSIVRAANGDLLAFAEGRVESCSDSTHTVRGVLRRSHDNGRTWGPLQVVARFYDGDDERAAQNIAPVVDAATGRVIVLYNGLADSEWALSDGVGQNCIFQVTSDDHGATWSAPVDITAQVHRPEPPARWQVQRPVLGHAIQLRHPARRGRLLHAGMFSYGDKSVFESRNYLFWSDDGGASWHIGGVIERDGLNEATAVELENGDILINSRTYDDGRPAGRRGVTRARFDGETLRFSDTALDPALVDPAVQASILRYSWSDNAALGGRSRILFSNPAHPQARLGMTVRLSYDEGRTWPIARLIDPGPSAYSDLVVLANNRIGLLYERGNHGGITFVSFSLDWLIDGQDRLE